MVAGADDRPDELRTKVYGERRLYDNPWVRLIMVDIEPPDGHRFEPSARTRRTLREGETELLAAEKLSTRTVAYAHAVLRKALNDAVNDESIKRNICLLVDAPTVASGLFGS